MAEEEKKKPASGKMYGKSPRIEPSEKKGDTVKSEGGAPKEAAAEAEKTAAEPESQGNQTAMADSPGSEVAGDVMKGTDGIPTHHTQSNEREALHGQHMTEHAHMHGRHEKDHLLRATGNHSESHEDMNKRHVGEKRQMHSRHEREMKEMGERHAMAAPMPDEEPVGEAGTQPT